MSSAIAKHMHIQARPDRDNCNGRPNCRHVREVRPYACIWEAHMHMYMCAGARARVLLPRANSALPRARVSAIAIASVLPCTASVLPHACRQLNCLNVVLQKAQAATQWPREQGHDVCVVFVGASCVCVAYALRMCWPPVCTCRWSGRGVCPVC